MWTWASFLGIQNYRMRLGTRKTPNGRESASDGSFIHWTVTDDIATCLAKRGPITNLGNNCRHQFRLEYLFVLLNK